MKEKKNTESGVPEKAKKRNLYFILLAACALVLVAAITFTVVMVTRDSGTTHRRGPRLFHARKRRDRRHDLYFLV